MIYQDRIYGKVKIEEPIILELIKSKSFQRLKGVDQVGYLPLYSQLHSSYFKKLTRFEHSLGVFILLKKFNVPFEEQVAGLIHDISHTIFSHAIDYVVSDGSGKTQCYQDRILESFIKNSEIAPILKKWGLKLEYILNKNNFPLLEKELPDLCADRIDYSLRNAVCFGLLKKECVNYFLSNLFIKNSFWIFKNFRSAKRFAQLFLKLNLIHYAGFPTAVMFRTVGDLLKYGLERNYFSRNDLFTTERKVITKIKRKLKSDQKLKLLFDRMIGKMKVEYNPKNYNVLVFCKSRIVDPLFETKGRPKRLSEVNKDWANVIKKELKPKEYFIKFEK